MHLYVIDIITAENVGNGIPLNTELNKVNFENLEKIH